jgi:hypothetical protein
MPQDTPETAAPATATPEQSTQTAPETTAPAAQSTETQVPADYEFNGDRNSVPEPLKKHVAGIDRYLTKKQQAFADTEKKAREYEAILNSPEFKAFQQFKATGAKAPNSTGSEITDGLEATQEEMDAIALGDQKTFKAVIDRQVKAALDPHTGPLKEQLNGLAAKQKEAETTEMIKAFAEVHTDFWPLFDQYETHMTAALKTGMNLEDAYKAFKDIEAKADERADKRYRESIEAKKKGSVAASTTTGTPDVVYAKDENEAKRLAIQMTLKGDPRGVEIRK